MSEIKTVKEIEAAGGHFVGPIQTHHKGKRIRKDDLFIMKIPNGEIDCGVHKRGDYYWCDGDTGEAWKMTN